MNKGLYVVTVALALLGLVTASQADVLDMGSGQTSIRTVYVGDAGNAGRSSGGTDPIPSRTCGAVAYNYYIGKYEITAGQYVEFLNAKAGSSDTYGLYNSKMSNTNADPANGYGCNIQRSGSVYSVAPEWANRPVNYVSFWDACRFANWVYNGQGNGNTEIGAYNIPGNWNTNPQARYGIAHNSGATWWIATEDEWYKAAYYKGGGTNAGYWDYPTRSNTAPANDILVQDPGNSANTGGIGDPSVGSPYWRSNVGEFENSASAYGTYDQGGNVWEWTESILTIANQPAGFEKASVIRGGGWDEGTSNMDAANRFCYYADAESYSIGFRLASNVSVVPEPSSLASILAGTLATAGRILKRRAR